MKTITLKLTKSEVMLLSEMTFKDTTNALPDELYRVVRDYELVEQDGGGYDVEIPDVDKFREFLNDEIDKCFPVIHTTPDGIKGRFIQMQSCPNGAFYEGSESQKQDNLKSILSKLDKEVK